ncbi:MAG: phosphatidate cytidylyltransferase [Deltaproteobacteria bacterium]|nr:phosphatidate cytidylyltransferase [Deltaproteobacteria bacterium]
MKRVITGFLLGSLFILLVLYATAFLFFALVTLIISLALLEYYKITVGQEKGLLFIGTLLGAIVPVIIYFIGLRGIAGYLIIAVFFIFTYCLFIHKQLVSAASRIGIGILGVTYIAFPLSHIIALRKLEHGSLWVLFLILIVSANDIFAYYIGRGIGRHKLSPVVSPNKTMEGALGGLIGGVVVAIVFQRFFLAHIALNEALLAIFIGILGQTSDLFESLIKRSAGVKDSGHILPGHGGVLDRVDSLIFPIPFLYYYLIIFRV